MLPGTPPPFTPEPGYFEDYIQEVPDIDKGRNDSGDDDSAYKTPDGEEPSLPLMTPPVLLNPLEGLRTPSPGQPDYVKEVQDIDKGRNDSGDDDSAYKTPDGKKTPLPCLL